MMTKPDFIALAEALKSAAPQIPLALDVPSQVSTYEHQADTWNACVRVIADTCKLRSPNFQRERFYAACGYVRTDHTGISSQ